MWIRSIIYIMKGIIDLIHIINRKLSKELPLRPPFPFNCKNHPLTQKGKSPASPFDQGTPGLIPGSFPL